MTTTTFSVLLASLTLEQAREWQAQDEQFLHVADTFDAVLNHEGSVIEARVEAIEARFNELLQNNA